MRELVRPKRGADLRTRLPPRNRVGMGFGRGEPALVAPDDTMQLRRCVRDLVALSMLPAIWNGGDLYEIADGIIAALMAMLDPLFVYIKLGADDGEPVIETTRALGLGHLDLTLLVRTAFASEPPGRSVTMRNPFGEGTVSVAFEPIGLGQGSFLLAASRRSDFPTESQRVLIRVAANHATTALRRRQAEAEQRRFAALVENSSDFIGVASLGGVPRYINPAGRRLVGLDPADQIDQIHILDFVDPENLTRVRDEIWPVVMRQGRWAGEISMRHLKTGASIPFLVDWFRIDDPGTGQPMNIATMSRDLTAQKRFEAELRQLNGTLEHRVAKRTAELAEVNRKLAGEIAEQERASARFRDLQLELFHAARLSAAGQMAAALAHELNQPLTAATISLNTARRILADGTIDSRDSAREVLEEAAGQTLRAGHIIHRLRDFVAGGEAERSEENVASMIEEAGALALTGATALGAEVRFRFDPRAEAVLADRIQIQQVLVNLMRNGLEAISGSSRRDLTVSTKRLDHWTVEIGVADSGPGIDQEVLDRLFEPFVSTKRGGMGLGLWVSRAIVEAHGGRIRAEQVPDGGTVFRFTLTAVPERAGIDAD